MKETKFKQTEIGEIPEDWELVKLKECVKKIFCGRDPKGGKQNHSNDTTGYKIIQSAPVFDGYLNKSKIGFITKEMYEDLMTASLKKDDVLLNQLGDGITFARSCVVPDDVLPAVITRSVGCIRCDKSKLDPYFLNAFLILPKTKTYIESFNSGSSRRAIDGGKMRSFLIPLPSIEEQTIIGSIYKKIQDKIELNQQMNKILETMGQAIFKKLFVDEKKEEWKVSTIGKELKTILGGTPDRTNPSYWNGDTNWINSGKVNEFRIIEPSEKITKMGLENSSTKILPKGTVVLAITGATLGQVSRLEIESCANQSVVGILENKKLASEYIYYWIQHNIKDIISHQTGGAQQHINKNNIDSYKILVPEQKILDNFNRLIRPIFDKISLNCFQSQILLSLRDSLLPKLMSGKIRVD